MNKLIATIVVASAIFVVPACRPADWEGTSSAPEEHAQATAESDADEGKATVVAGVQAVPNETPVWVTSTPRLTTPGQQLSVIAHGFSHNEEVDVALVDQEGQQVAGPLRGTTDLRGALSTVPLRLPGQIEAGEYTVVVRSTASEREGRAPVWIQANPPALELSRDAVRPEESLSISGSGFAPRERVVIYFEGQGVEPLTALSTDQKGSFHADNVPMPMIAAGEQQLVATGSASLGKAQEALQILQFEPVVTLNASIVPPGETVGLFGYGFAARDRIDIIMEGSSEPWGSANTDDRGRLVAPQAFELPANIQGPQTFSLRAQRTGRTVRVPFEVTRSFPLVELSSYFGKPGGELTLSVRYLRPRERLEVFLGEGGQRKKLATFRADDNGWLPKDSRIQIPQDATPGPLTLAMEGEANRPPMRAKYTVLQ